jgi:hypothetical protein
MAMVSERLRLRIERDFPERGIASSADLADGGWASRLDVELGLS